MLEFKNVSYCYDEGLPLKTMALKNVNVTINKGEFIGLIGHTGSGKSTMVQHMNGLLKATSGDILYNGKSIYDKSFSLKELRQHIGLVFQYPEHQLFEATILEDVCFGPKNMKLDEKTCRERAVEALNQVGLDETYYELSPFELSGGQKRRVAIAGVLAMGPDMLVLDEPTAGLDPTGRDEILNRLQLLHDEMGMTIVLVSHSMEDVANYVDRIIVMNDAQVVYDDVPEKVFEHRASLEQMGLAVPQMTYIMQELHSRGFGVDVSALTVDKAADSIMSVVGKNRC